MLLFLEDSFDRRGEGYVHVLGGFTMPPQSHRPFLDEMQRIKRHYFLQDRNFSAEEREAAWQDHFIVGADPALVELKASLLLSSSILRRRGPVALRIAQETLEALRTAGATVHFASSTPPSLRSGLTMSHLEVFESVQRAHRGQGPIYPVLDSTNPMADRALARTVLRYLTSEDGAERFPDIDPQAFVLDTHTSLGLQAADLVAHVLLQRCRPEQERKPLEILDAIVRSLEV